MRNQPIIGTPTVGYEVDTVLWTCQCSQLLAELYGQYVGKKYVLLLLFNCQNTIFLIKGIDKLEFFLILALIVFKCCLILIKLYKKFNSAPVFYGHSGRIILIRVFNTGRRANSPVQSI
jgi:hypothetical protein